ncbi:TIGR02679 family protein [Peribacillus sp. SCS-26]|uniref:TIGR02679 family protein n=1 Tax=Paraperibacillus marinus TaxID=3115295 RepID=UPI0039066373
MYEKIRLFKEEPGFPRLFSAFKEKYRSLGRIGGSVKLEGYSDEDIEAIAGFLGSAPHHLKTKPSVSLIQFERQMGKTNLAGFTLIELLEAFFDEPLQSKSDELMKAVQLEKQYYDLFIQEFPNVSWWFERILEKKPDTRFLQALYKKDSSKLAEWLRNAAHGFTNLPHSDLERLPLFSQRITGNPHAFDINEIQGKVFLHLLSAHQAAVLQSDPQPSKSTEQINELLLQYGLLRDDLWSFITCRGFTAYYGSDIHPVWEAAAAFGTVMNVPLKELARLNSISPRRGKKIWIVENSSVCSTIMDAVPDCPIVCTHGQFRVASWLFLDKLVEADCTIYYASDLDPEGLQMAQRLKVRYPDSVIIWRMDPQSYLSSLSSESIEERLPQLVNVTDPELMETASIMKEKKMAAYQEAMVDLLIGDILKHNNEAYTL